MKTINESGMSFKVDGTKTFHIEKSSIYQARNIHGISSVEFVTLAPQKRVVFMEARTDAPRDTTEFSLDIEKKFSHSIQLCLALSHGILEDPQMEMPGAIRDELQDKPRFWMILVVKELAAEHCDILQNCLNQKLSALRHIWDMHVLVFNENGARKRCMIA